MLQKANKLLQVSSENVLFHPGWCSPYMSVSWGGSVLNTALIERFNGKMLQRLAALRRKCRHAAQRFEARETCIYLIGCTYTFCVRHEVACVEWSSNSQPSVQGCP
jgi:hypothetical protein